MTDVVEEDEEEFVLTDAARAMAEEAESFAITLNELAVRDLTLREVALLLNNHSRAVGYMEAVIANQEQRIMTLMYTLAAYTRQYPLDLDKLQAGDLSPITPVPPTDDAAHRPGMYL